MKINTLSPSAYFKLSEKSSMVDVSIKLEPLQSDKYSVILEISKTMAS